MFLACFWVVCLCLLCFVWLCFVFGFAVVFLLLLLAVFCLGLLAVRSFLALPLFLIKLGFSKKKIPFTAKSDTASKKQEKIKFLIFAETI